MFGRVDLLCGQLVLHNGTGGLQYKLALMLAVLAIKTQARSHSHLQLRKHRIQATGSKALTIDASQITSPGAKPAR
jgi:hypothetical protein